MARSLGSFYDRSGTPVCPDERCVDEKTGDRSVMVPVGDRVFECPNAHGKRRVVRRDPRPYPDLPRQKPGEVNKPINARPRLISSPFGSSRAVEPSIVNGYAIKDSEKRQPNASHAEIIDAYRELGGIVKVQQRLRVGRSTIQRALAYGRREGLL